MSLRVGNITVRRQHRFKRTASGIRLPMLSTADLEETTDRERSHKEGMELHRRADGLLVTEGLMYRTPRTSHIQLVAQDHAKACMALDKTPAGRKARDLLFDHLEPHQRRTAERYFYFDIGLIHPAWLRDAYEGKSYGLDTVRIRILRGLPNGNVLAGSAQHGYCYALCLHPLSPYPTDDIALSQYLLLMNEPDEFIRSANVTLYSHNNPRDAEMRLGRPIKFGGMFEKPPPPPKVIIPYVTRRGT